MTSDTTTTNRALKVSEVAGPEHLNCNEAAVYRLIASGALKSFRVGRFVRVRESAVAEFIQQQEG